MKNGIENLQVGTGDSLTLIATRFNTTAAELTIINNLKSSFIYPGQQLFVPSETDRKDAEEDDEAYAKYGLSGNATDKTRQLPMMTNGQQHQILKVQTECVIKMCSLIGI